MSAVVKKESGATIARPIFKYAGGKTQLLPELLRQVPERFGTYHEPFLGGGALFWALASAGRVEEAFISDRNELLIRVFRAVRDRVDELVRRLSVLSPDPNVFYTIRKTHPSELTDDLEAAVWFIYLNKSGFNGLYRVNKKGFFNVPPGKFVRPPKICDEENLRACSEILNRRSTSGVRSISVLAQPFEEVLLIAKEGDLCYFDPPYPSLSKTSNFTSYTEHGFSWADQERLRDVALELKNRGVHVILSNSDQERVRDLYSVFKLKTVQASRAINSKVSGRGKIAELVIT